MLSHESSDQNHTAALFYIVFVFVGFSRGALFRTTSGAAADTQQDP